MYNKISDKLLLSYKKYLSEQERSPHTIAKYLRDVRRFAEFLGGKALCKEQLIRCKNLLVKSYAPSSVNSMLAAINSFLAFIGRAELRVKPLKTQKALFSSENELSKPEYFKLLSAAKNCGNERLMLIAETICSTGIRVSELCFITAEAVRSGRAEVRCKGKHRLVFLPEKLRGELKKYLDERGITSGAVFLTRGGKPVDRSNVWRELKKLGETAGVEAKKIYPHNLRHLFARTFYNANGDLLRLADILGHSDINTTRIYTLESGSVHARLIEKLDLVFTT